MSRIVDKEIEQITKEVKKAFIAYLLEGMPWDKNSNAKKGDLKSMWFQLDEFSGTNRFFQVMYGKLGETELRVKDSCFALALNENNWQKIKEVITNCYVTIRQAKGDPIAAPRAYCMLDIQIERAWEKFKKDFINKNKTY